VFDIANPSAANANDVRNRFMTILFAVFDPWTRVKAGARSKSPSYADKTKQRLVTIRI